jgi:hypothetical protein
MKLRRGRLRLIALASGTRMDVSRCAKAPAGSVVGRLLDAFDEENGELLQERGCA